MDEFNYLQFLNYDCELLEAEEVLLGEFPTFSVQFDEYFNNFSYTSAPDPCYPESSNIACEQALLFGRVKLVSRERASERRDRKSVG